jgi:hypothetical protein
MVLVVERNRNNIKEVGVKLYIIMMDQPEINQDQIASVLSLGKASKQSELC